MSILVTGGAGYIGSHCVEALISRGSDVVVADNLSKGHKEAVKNAKLYVGDINDKVFLDDLFDKEDIEAVIHFAAFSLVGESMKEPGKYFSNNLGGSVCLLDAMRRHDVNYIVFSSTAATYGEPKTTPITEDMETLPTNPYGESKLMVEKSLKWFNCAHDIKYAALRYFNVAGASESGDIGEDHQPETHIIPIVLQTALGKRDFVSIFGTDYTTPDGTCIRDYIHVCDLIDAHLLSLDYLKCGGDSGSFNLGIGKGFSVMEIIEAAKIITGINIKTNISGRREGDPAVLIASGDKAMEKFNWRPNHTDISEIIDSAWKWHKNHPDGY